jgi:hypothetical protein
MNPIDDFHQIHPRIISPPSLFSIVDPLSIYVILMQFESGACICSADSLFFFLDYIFDSSDLILFNKMITYYNKSNKSFNHHQLVTLFPPNVSKCSN